MRKILDKVLKVFLAFILVFNTLVFVSPNIVVDTMAKENEYEIYPIPHNMEYTDGEYVIRPDVNIVVEGDIDEVTLQRVEEVFEMKNKNISFSSKIVKGKTNVLIGTYGSKGYVDKYVSEHYTLTADLFNHFGAYFLASDNDTIVILGANTDGAFYALTSLKHIFNQMDGSTIRNFEMKDYADANIRGFIEGYYGIPWSNEDRMSLMKFGGDFKMTSYVFAPKDDPYHSARWRDPYPQDKLEEIREMAQVGNETKCRFVWTIHPFMNGGITASSYDADIEKIIAKFEQLYEVGVRQFGVLGDDAGNLPRNVVIKVMNDLQAWVDEKGDVYNLVFCPQGYNHSWQGNYSELNELDAGFPKDVQIFWTGEAVCQPVEQKTLDHFRRYNATNGERRAPLFWLNWPVNDINAARMLMGKGSLLHTDINVDDIYGVVTNPMQEAEASKVALFAVADYTWNVKAFDDDQSWIDSFKYIDEDASEALHTLAKHMSNPQPNGHGLVLAESEELQPLLNEFNSALANGSDLTEVSKKLIKELTIIAEACDEFHSLSKNESLKDELFPFTHSLKNLCLSIISFINAKEAIDNEDMYSAFNHYTKGSSLLSTSQTFTKPLISGEQKVVTPGSTYLIPLADKLSKEMAEPINDYVAEGNAQKIEITASSSYNTWYSGNVNNIADGDKSTFAWHNGSESSGAYFQINLSQPSTIYGVDIYNGTTSKNDDTFGYAKLYYQTQGSSQWQELNGTEYGPYSAEIHVTDIEIDNVVTVRYQCSRVGGSGKWTAMREFSVVTESIGSAKAYTNTDTYANHGVVLGYDNASLNALSNVTLNKDEYIGIKLDRIHEITNIVSDLTNGSELTLEVGKNEYEMNEYKGQTADARYIRLINKTSSPITFDINELSLTSFEIKDKSFVQSLSTFSIYDATNNPASNLFDGDRTTQVIYYGSQTQGRHFVYDLGQVIDLETLKVVCRDSEHDWPRHAKISVSLDGKTWEDIMDIGSATEELPGESTNEDNINDVLPLHETSYNAKEATDINLEVQYIKFEITKTKVGSDKWIRFQEFEINSGEYMPTLNDPTFESTSEETKDGQFVYLTDGSLSTSFVPVDKTGTLTYAVSDHNEVNKVKIIQSENNISHAVVKVRTTEGTITLGTLSQTLNEFILPENTVILDVQFIYENCDLNIAELMLLNADYKETNKTALDALLKEDVDTSSWILLSRIAYENALEIGKKVKDNTYASQDSIDSIVREIEAAKVNKQLMASLTQLQKAYNAVSDLKAEDYTVKSFRVFEAKRNAVLKAIQEINLVSEADGEEIIAELNEAYEALVYTPSQYEEAVLTIEDENSFVASIKEPTKVYSSTTWNTYLNAKKVLTTLVEADNAHPSEIREALSALKTAKANLKPAQVTFPFTDVSNKQWYYGVINEAYQLGLMTGATETLFKPNANMNRGMVAIVFHRMEGSKKVEYSSIFPDVAKNQYYTTSVLWAKQTGVINGYTNGTFKPLRNVTREEMATMIYNFARYKGLDMSASKDITYFDDYNKITPYAVGPLQWAVEKGLMSGKDNGTRLDPLGTATRAECSKMLVQAYKVIYK